MEPDKIYQKSLKIIKQAQNSNKRQPQSLNNISDKGQQTNIQQNKNQINQKKTQQLKLSQIKPQVKIIANGKKIFTFSMFPQDPFILDPHFQIYSIKGWGTYSKVAEGKNLITGQKIAIKRTSPIFDNLQDAKRILREIKIQKFLKHKNIMSMKQILQIQHPQSFNQIYICMEFMQYTLRSVIYNRQFKLTQKMIQFIMYQLLSATYYMHSANIIHRDFKPDNILVNQKLQIKITDMNLARKQTNDKQTYYVTTRPYRAPQLFLNSNFYTKAIDMWSIGCILAQMLGKTILFQGRDYVDQIKRFVAILGKPCVQDFLQIDQIVAQGLANLLKQMSNHQKIKWQILYPDASKEALDLLDKLLVYRADKRLTAQQCLNHDFLKDFRSRQKVACQNVLDFTFDKIQMTPENLRKALIQQIGKNQGLQTQKKIKLN